MKVAVLGQNRIQVSLMMQALSSVGYICDGSLKREDLFNPVCSFDHDLIFLEGGVFGSSLVDLLRAHPKSRCRAIPIVLFSRCYVESNVVNGLDCGADDFLIFPLPSDLLVAKIEAIFRRFEGGKLIRINFFNDFIFDQAIGGVVARGRLVLLTRREFDVSVFLFKNINAPVHRDKLKELFWISGSLTDSRTLDTHMAGIRRKLELFKGEEYSLVSIYGYGYCLRRAIDGDNSITERWVEIV
ncbi:MAG: response regulator transcription factor [Burkholderia sp.]